MNKSRRTKVSQAPPQLIAILTDAIAIGAPSFRLVPNPPHTMASFGTSSKAVEIDFEAWYGREMVDFLDAQVTDAKKKTGQFVMEVGGKRYACNVAVDHIRGAKQAEVTWK